MSTRRLLTKLSSYLSFCKNRARILRLKAIGVDLDFSINLGSDVDVELGYTKGKQGILKIGTKTQIARGVVLHCYGGSINISNNVFLGSYTVIYGNGGVEINKDTLIATHCRIISSNHKIPDKNTRIRSQSDILLPVTIGEDVWIGAGVTILGGISIGNGCVVGAGSVVTRNLPPYSVAMGIPAKVVRSRE